MLKFNAIALLCALVATCVLASPTVPQLDLEDENLDDYEVISEVSLFPEDDTEVKNLPETQKVFSDYCITSRDHTKKWLSDKTNEAASVAFESLFDRLISVGRSSISKTVEETQEQANEVRNVDEEEEQLTLFQKIFRACRAVIQKTYEVAKQTLTEYARDVMGQFTKKDLEIVEKACRLFTADLKPKLQSQFDQTKSGITRANPALKETIGQLGFKELKCTTTRRILTIAKSCETFATLQSVVLPMIMRD